ncbi:MAG: zeta toxin family protein [Ruminococcus sp.]|nr:zeta toxin family protein [Ruminococcus sp.]
MLSRSQSIGQESPKKSTTDSCAPALLVFAGPNGSGKSTITAGINVIGEYINADLIQRELGCDALEAAQIATKTREYFLEKEKSFTFETVMSTPEKIDFLKRAHEKQYRIICIYVLTYDPAINIKRVKKRVANGGHSVPEDKIVTRYTRALRLLPQLFEVCDELYIFDNSADCSNAVKSMIFSLTDGIPEVKTTDIWTKERLKSLLSGTYPDDYIIYK